MPTKFGQSRRYLQEKKNLRVAVGQCALSIIRLAAFDLMAYSKATGPLLWTGSFLKATRLDFETLFR